MKKLLPAILSLASLFLIGLLSFSHPTLAQEATATPTVTPTPSSNDTQRVADLNKRIKELEEKVSGLQSQGKTLSSEIAVMDNKVKLTQFRINATEQEIETLGEDIEAATSKISSLEQALDSITKAMLGRVVATYQQGSVAPMQALLSSESVTTYLNRANYLKIVQAHDKKLLYEVQQAKTDYQNQKEVFEDKKVKVEALKVEQENLHKQLEQDKKAREQLLSVTKNDEARYQKLLSEARAQIASFRNFATAQGGSVLPPQDSPDGWYFNQRDERWGRNYIGNSSEVMWQVGCLVTSTAMVRKQRGENVTPLDVARESSFFFANTAMMNIPWNGGRFQSVWQRDLGAIDSKLASGQPVIVGLNVGGQFSTHFVVLKSGSGGNYIMNDPWNGANLNFTSYYSTGQIFQYGYLK